MLALLARLFSPEVQRLTSDLALVTLERDWQKQLANTYKAERDLAAKRELSVTNKLVKLATGDANGLPTQVEQPRTESEQMLFDEKIDGRKLSEDDRSVLLTRAKEWLVQKGDPQPTNEAIDFVFNNMLSEAEFWLSDS